VNKKTVAAKPNKKLSEETEAIVQVIRKAFVDNAHQIAQKEKTEDLLKMIMRSDDGNRSTMDHKELWKLIEKVRKEVLSPPQGRKTTATKKPRRSSRKAVGR